MISEQLKKTLEKILTDEANTNAVRKRALADAAIVFFADNKEAADLDIEQLFEEWNQFMVTLVEKHNLRRH